MSVVARRPGWAEVIQQHAAATTTAPRVIAQLFATEVAGLAFCRLLERWARGDADPCTPGRREAALQRAADRVETALAGLEEPLGRYLLELEADIAEGRSWYGEPSHAELLDWEPEVPFVDGLHRTIDWYFETKDPADVAERFETALTER